MFGRKKSDRQILDNYLTASQEFEKLLTQQLWEEYRRLVAAMAAICRREGDLWAYEHELDDLDMEKFDVKYDEENKALVFSYRTE